MLKARRTQARHRATDCISQVSRHRETGRIKFNTPRTQSRMIQGRHLETDCSQKKIRTKRMCFCGPQAHSEFGDEGGRKLEEKPLKIRDDNIHHQHCNVVSLHRTRLHVGIIPNEQRLSEVCFLKHAGILNILTVSLLENEQDEEPVVVHNEEHLSDEGLTDGTQPKCVSSPTRKNTAQAT